MGFWPSLNVFLVLGFSSFLIYSSVDGTCDVIKFEASRSIKKKKKKKVQYKKNRKIENSL